MTDTIDFKRFSVGNPLRISTWEEIGPSNAKNVEPRNWQSKRQNPSAKQQNDDDSGRNLRRMFWDQSSIVIGPVDAAVRHSGLRPEGVWMSFRKDFG
jgi:hypothetical protein